MKEKQLLDLKKQIESDKNEVAEMKGRRQGLMQVLKKKWQCNSLEEANQKIEELEKEKEYIQEKINEGIRELEENYEL